MGRRATFCLPRGTTVERGLSCSGVCVYELRHGNVRQEVCCGRRCLSARQVEMRRFGVSDGSVLPATGYFLPVRRAESHANRNFVLPAHAATQCVRVWINARARMTTDSQRTARRWRLRRYCSAVELEARPETWRTQQRFYPSFPAAGFADSIRKEPEALCLTGCFGI